MKHDPSVSVLSHPDTVNTVKGFFPDGMAKPLRAWWEGLSSTQRRLVAAAAIVTGVVTFYNTASEAYQYYFAGYQKADEVTTIYNEKTGDVLKTLFKAVENVSPSIDDIEAARVAGDENKAYYMTMAYGMQATAIIKGDSDLKYAAESFFTDINNVAICATDGCDREALIQNMEQAFCRADRKFGRWLANFRKQKFKASFAQEYVTLVATIPCASILYPKATT